MFRVAAVAFRVIPKKRIISRNSSIAGSAASRHSWSDLGRCPANLVDASCFIGIGLTQGIINWVVGALRVGLYGTARIATIRSLATAALVAPSVLGPGIAGLLIDRGDPAGANVRIRRMPPSRLSDLPGSARCDGGGHQA